jgi:signal transduction histidine kinase
MARPAVRNTGRVHRSRWLDLLAMTRVLGASVAVLLLIVHEVSDYDGWLVFATITWTALSLGAFASSERLQQSPLAWLVDIVVALAFVWLSTDWRSPFYVFALTTLILPATELPFRRGVTWGVGFMLAYLITAIATERLGGETFERAVRLEIITTHLMVPLVVVLALGYASDVLRRLADERRRTERLAVQAERQRIAWELHDSAKQRVHAAHLVLSALDGRVPPGEREVVDHALAELRAATADMDTSVAELRAPLDGRPVDLLLRQRAGELQPASAAPITVVGTLPELPPLVATHAYRIAAEALTNAVRHSGATSIEVELRAGRDSASIVVRDDGAGLPDEARPGSHGLPSMRNRAETIGATLDLTVGPDGRGTVVRLDVPLHQTKETTR